MTRDEIVQVLNKVEFEDWRFDVLLEEGGRLVLRVRFGAADNVSGERAVQRGRKWFLSLHMTRSEVVSTALKAVLTAVEHEAREKFLYRGRAIFGPHHDVELLHELAGAAPDVRAVA